MYMSIYIHIRTFFAHNGMGIPVWSDGNSLLVPESEFPLFTALSLLFIYTLLNICKCPLNSAKNRTFFAEFGGHLQNSA